MKRLTERTEIAKAINFGKYPVIPIDLSNVDEYGIKGTKVRIDFGGEYMIHATIRAYSDEKVLTTTQGATCLTKTFGYYDFMEIVEYANTPIIKPNQEIVIALYNSKTKQAYAPAIIKTSEHYDRFCVCPLKLEKFEVL